MNSSFSQILAGRGDAAIAAFTCYNLESAVGVLTAAARRQIGVILLVSANSFRGHGGELLLAALVSAADRSSAPACVQLDHVADLDLIESAFKLGAGAVMADGSQLSFDENVALVRAAAECGATFGGQVEGELGRIEGDEDVAHAAKEGALTEPGQAASFVRDTGAACLAVSIGNVHGVYRGSPNLDWPRLEAIRERIDVPVSLHGASGLSSEDLRRAVSLDVAKVNVNTELRQRYLDVTEELLPAVREGARVLDLNRAQASAIAEIAETKLAALKIK